jgi:hypothetical protein
MTSLLFSTATRGRSSEAEKNVAKFERAEGRLGGCCWRHEAVVIKCANLTRDRVLPASPILNFPRELVLMPWDYDYTQVITCASTPGSLIAPYPARSGVGRTSLIPFSSIALWATLATPCSGRTWLSPAPTVESVEPCRQGF